MRATPLVAWIAVFAVCGAGVACSLNPQPLPPGDTTSADAGVGAMDSGSPFGGADAAEDVGSVPAPDAGVDASASDGGADAADASEDAAVDAPLDAPLDALDEGD